METFKVGRRHIRALFPITDDRAERRAGKKLIHALPLPKTSSRNCGALKRSWNVNVRRWKKPGGVNSNSKPAVKKLSKT